MGTHVSDHVTAAKHGCCFEQSAAMLEPTVQTLSVGLEKFLTLHPPENSDLNSCVSTPLIEELQQQLDTADSDSSSDSSSLSSGSESSESDSPPAHTHNVIRHT